MSMLRASSATLFKRLIVLITAIGLLISLVWYYNEDITQPWLPPRPTNLSKVDKVVVVPTVKFSEVQWIKDQQDLLGGFEWIIYCMGRSTSHPECHTPKAREGREAAGYLSYILDYYDDLPKYSIFVHSGAQQWHNDILGTWTFPSLLNFRYEAADKMGYVNLRCRFDPGCPWSIRPFQVSDHDRKMDNGRSRYVDDYQYLLNVSSKQVPEEMGTVCCAQFVATREKIRARPKSDYERMLKWLVESDNTSFDKGWFFEMTWHVIFGKDAVNCPRVEQCRCDLYGWCGPLTGTGEKLKAIGR